MGKFNVLQNSILFNHLTEEEIKRISRMAVQKTFVKGSTILAENMSSMALYVILEGSVEILKKIGVDKDKSLITLMGGECFGELSLFDDAPHSAVVKASVDTTLLIIQKNKFDKLLEENPSLGVKILKKLIKILSYRLRQSNEQMLNIMAWSLYAQQMK